MAYVEIAAGTGLAPTRPSEQALGAAIAAGIANFVSEQEQKSVRQKLIDSEILPKPKVPVSKMHGELSVVRGITPEHLPSYLSKYDNFINLFGQIIPDEAGIGDYTWKLIDLKDAKLSSDLSELIPRGYSLGSIDHLTPLAEQQPVLVKYTSDYINKAGIHTGIPWSSMNHILALGLQVTERYQMRNYYGNGFTDVDYSVAPALRCDWSGDDGSSGKLGWSVRNFRTALTKVRNGSSKPGFQESFGEGTFLLVVKKK